LNDVSRTDACRALVWRGGRELVVESHDAPVPEPGQVALDVELAGICGSDLHGYRGHPGPRRPPLVLGHEAIGRVPGRDGHFAVFPLVACGECPRCQGNQENLCERRGLLGLDRPGVFTERTLVREDQLVPLPAGADPRVCVLVEPLATSVSAVTAVGAEPGERVAVIGCGPVGLLAVYACATRGLAVTAVEPLPRRRAVAERLGAEATVADVGDLQPGAFDLALDTAGFEPTWNGAVAAVRRGGAVVLIGLGDAEGRLTAGELVRGGIRLFGHYAYTRADFEVSLRMLTDHGPPLDWLTTMPLTDGEEAFRRLVDEPDRQAKVVLAMTGE
jgi:threonine dehydrogenase-like Zn-dependent dehydrogenase